MKCGQIWPEVCSLLPSRRAHLLPTLHHRDKSTDIQVRLNGKRENIIHFLGREDFCVIISLANDSPGQILMPPSYGLDVNVRVSQKLALRKYSNRNFRFGLICKIDGGAWHAGKTFLRDRSGLEASRILLFWHPLLEWFQPITEEDISPASQS